ncbi:MAG TPA: Ig domain-containing protein [Rhizomicrobium sp.]|nr:Ig domain-containing protein [Rhizomicrobium sp.]
MRTTISTRAPSGPRAVGLIALSFLCLTTAEDSRAHASPGCTFLNGQALTDDQSLVNYQILVQLFDAGDRITVHGISNPNGKTVSMFNIDHNYIEFQAVPPFAFTIPQGQAGFGAGRSVIYFDSADATATAVITCKAAGNFTLKQKRSATRRVGQSYLQTNTAGGGAAPYSFSISDGVLPAGTTLDASTGEVSGMPSKAGLFSYTVRVMDSTTPAPLTVKQTLSGRILPP